MRKLILIVYAITGMSLAGCVASPLKVDVEPQTKSLKVAESATRVAEIKFLNNKIDSKLVNNPFDDSYIPIRTEPSTKQIIQDDIQRFLTENVIIDPSAHAILTVKIQQAEAFWVLGVVDRIPFIGLATVGGDRNFLLNLKFAIEVEQYGKVKSTYFFEENFVARGSAALPSISKNPTRS